MSGEEAQERNRIDAQAKFSRLFAGFAHEVRNPLSSIGLNMGLIKEDFKDAQTARDRRTYKRLSVLEAEVKRLQTIVDEFLRYVRKPELIKRPTELNTLLQNLVDFAAPEMQEAGISLRFYPGQDVGLFEVDPDLFRATVVNLLRNAREACKAGDQIMVSCLRRGDEVLIRVTDTGPGMAPEVLAEVFTPYFSTKKSGTGLGLPITQKIVEEHGGSVEVTSEKGRGTQFTMHFPSLPLLAEGQDSGGQGDEP